LRRLPSFLSELSEKYNPLTDVVVRGDCVVNENILFLQGGSGFICSRAAARLLTDLTTFMELWEIAEDTTFGLFLDAIGIGVRNCCSGAFMGHGPDFLADVEHAVKCPPKNTSRHPVPHHLEPVRDLLVYHKKDNIERYLKPVIENAESLFKSPPELRWFADHDFWAETCTLEGNVGAIGGRIGRLLAEMKRAKAASLRARFIRRRIPA
jgi:hypothetical protein